MATKTTAKTGTKKVSSKKVTAATTVDKIEDAVQDIQEEVTEQATSLLEKVNTNLNSVQDVAKQVWFAGLGAVGRSVDEVQTRYVEANETVQQRIARLTEEREQLINDLVVRGEKVQGDAEVMLKESRANIEEQIEVAKNRLGGLVAVVDIPARLQDMSDKLESLSKDLKKSA